MTMMFWITCPLGKVCHWHGKKYDIDNNPDVEKAIAEVELHLIDDHWYTPKEATELIQNTIKLGKYTEMWRE